METQSRYPGAQYDLPKPEDDHESSRVDGHGQTPSSLSKAQDSSLPPIGNGMARTMSKRRRPSGSSNGKTQPENYFQPPAAPEVPKAPPLSYRTPSSTNGHGHAQPGPNYPASFAERARILTGRSNPQDTTNAEPERIEQPQKPKSERRASLNRPIGGLYSEIQQHRRDSYPSTASGPTSPRRFSVPSNTQQRQQESITRPDDENRSPAIQPTFEGPSPVTQSAVRRASAVQPNKKEWASDRSPLQNLEAKLEKRARVEEAEQKLRRSKAESKRESQGVAPAVIQHPLIKVPADAGASRSQKLSKQSTRTAIDRGLSGLGDRGSNDDRSVAGDAKHLRINSRTQRPGDIDTGFRQGSSGNPTRRASVNGADVRRASSQQDRAVRFQGEDDHTIEGQDTINVGRFGSQHRNRTSEVLEIDPASAEARAARREQLRQGLTTMTDRRGLRDVPPQQQTLYGAKAERGKISAASYGAMPDPIPADVVRSSNHVPKHEIPPQTAGGVQARQQVGFGSQPAGAINVPAQKKHHLSNILHRGHERAVHTHEQSGTQPENLDEWRRAGVARLVAADFMDEQETKEGSGRRRRSQRGSRSANPEAQTEQDGFPNSTGKCTSHSVQVGGTRGSQPLGTELTTSHARPYVSIDDSPGAKKSLVLRLKASLAKFARRSNSTDRFVLSSAYSYSCPDLADHDPSHMNHLCEPYLSPELTQSMRSIRIRPVPGVQTFSPPLYLKCGPLLRYTGLKRDTLESGIHLKRETWRGSVMIVTTDADSSYEPAPTLRLFPQPIELLPPPPQRVETEDRNDLPSEIVDPIAGLPRLSRTGKSVYVKPADDLEEAVDLSRIENDDGLFEETRTAAVPTSYGTPDFHHVRNGPLPKTPPRNNAKKGHRVRGIRLHAERGVTFWRFNLEVELGDDQARIAYSINNGSAIGFWVPARGHSMNVMFHSCNGFSMSVNPADFCGPDPLWRDVLNSHQTRPFHVMIGGGDQIYNDAVMRQSPLFNEWLGIKNLHDKFEAEFSSAMQEELETFYMERYAMWFSQGLFGMANSQIPMVNMWDDHDIIDGFGSYPHDFMITPVFCGLGTVAYKYYMLFQHQSVPDETSADEPSWVMGAAPGPYINELSRSVLVSLGKNVTFLAVDCRTERQRDEVLSQESYDVVFARCRREIIEGETKHLIVLLGIPIAYPRLVWLENLLTSRVMDPIKALGRMGMMGNFLNKFNGGVEILDDLDDHWTARHHKHERNWFIQELQQLAAEKSVRVTIMGGDVHLAAIGQFYSNPKLKIPKDRDHRYMANVISSAIVNTPPPEMMGDILNKRNKIHHLDHETDEDMIPMFTHDVDGKLRNNKRLLPRRNWCSIREYHPGSTPPPTPSPPPSEPQTPSDDENHSPSPPPTRLQRTMSLTRGDIKPGNLIRRLSGRGPPPASYLPSKDDENAASMSPSSPDGYFPEQPTPPGRSIASANGTGPPQRHSSAPLSRPGFQRRPTNMSEKAAKKGDIDDTSDHINLEHGLDIVLNCEVNQRDPAGITTPYRLLIPALWYTGPGDENTLPLRKESIMKRLTSLKGRRGSRLASGQGRGNWGQDDSHSGSGMSGSDSETDQGEEERRPRRWSFGLTQRRQYRDQTPPSLRESREQDWDKAANLQQATFPERPQQQRDLEHRNQQIGQYSTTRAGTQQQAFEKLTGQHQQLSTNEQLDGPEDIHRDSVDYHEHLDNVRTQQNTGNVGRRLSKADRMLGVGGGRQNNGNTSTGRNFSDRQKSEDGPTPYDDEDIDPPPTQSVANNRAFDGVDAYTEKSDRRKSWRRFLP